MFGPFDSWEGQDRKILPPQPTHFEASKWDIMPAVLSC